MQHLWGHWLEDAQSIMKVFPPLKVLNLKMVFAISEPDSP